MKSLQIAWGQCKVRDDKNCWHHMKILLLETTAIVTDNMDMDETNDDIAELVLALNNLSIVDSLTVEEYIDIDSNLVSTGLLTEEELIEEILLTESVLQQAQEDRREFK